MAHGQGAPGGRPLEREAPLLLGGPAERTEQIAPIDPALPSGALRWVRPRPTQDGLLRWCSPKRPVCVHAPRAADAARPAEALGALEAAYERLVYGFSLPAPLGDQGAGGGDELDWYLATDTAAAGGQPPTGEKPLDEPQDGNGAPDVALEALPSRGFDRAAAYCLGESSDLERSATLCVAEASAAARTPATSPSQRRSYATQVWWSLGRVTSSDEDAIFRTQHAPEQPVLARRKGPLSEGSALFFAYLDRVGAQARPVLTSTSALALSATRTPAGALRYRSEPDVADVIRSTFFEKRERVARFWDEFARARFLVDRADGWLGWPGASGRVRRAWTVKSSSLPRNLVLPRPLFPSGSAYLVLEMDHQLNTLAFRATCEGPVSYVWSVLRFDARGNELSSVRVPFKEREPRTEQRISDLEGARELVFVGTNLGGVDLAHPFDPDHEPFEPHGCTVYLTAQVL